MGPQILAPKAWCCLHFQAALLPLSPQPPAPANLNKASFHVFIELLLLRHFASTIRLFEGFELCRSRAGAGVENGSSPGPGARLVPSPPYVAPGSEQRGMGAGGSREAILWAPICFSAKWGQQSLRFPTPQGLQLGFEGNTAPPRNSVQDCPGPGCCRHPMLGCSSPHGPLSSEILCEQPWGLHLDNFA